MVQGDDKVVKQPTLLLYQKAFASDDDVFVLIRYEQLVYSRQVDLENCGYSVMMADMLF